MSIIEPLIQQVLIMFLLMGMGYALNRLGILSEQAAIEFGKLLINLVIPAIILKSFWIEYSFQRMYELGMTLMLSAAMLLLACVVARLLFRGRPIDIFAAAFSNAGFVGIPLVEAALGKDAVFFITCMIALLNAMQWTYGQYLLSGSKKCMSPKAILTSPMVMALLGGFLIFILRGPTVPLAQSVLSYISGLNTPLAMMTLGIYLAQSDLMALLRAKSLFAVSSVRLLVIPILSLLFLCLFPCERSIKMALLIAAATPTGANVAIFAQQHNKDYRYACGTVCVTTLLSMFTMPAIVSLSQLVF